MVELANNLAGRGQHFSHPSHYLPISGEAFVKSDLHCCSKLRLVSRVSGSYLETAVQFTGSNIYSEAGEGDGALPRCDSELDRQVLVVSSDKCYRNDELGRPFTENDPLGGKDPYSASKAGTEIAAESYRSSFFGADDAPLIASARAGNVIGGGDWSMDRLFPDATRAFAQGRQLIVRNPDSVRPWQHVLEPVCGYLLLVEKLAKDPNRAKGWNFGPIPPEGVTVRRVVDMAVAAWGADATWTTPETIQSFAESKLLTLDCTAAEAAFGWRSVLSAEQTIKWTMQWYRTFQEFGPKAARALTNDQIEDYFALQNRGSLKR